MVEKDKEVKKYNYAIMLSTAGAIFSILIIFFAIKPLYQKNILLSSESKEKKIRYDNLITKKSNLAALKNKEAELRGMAEKVRSALPEAKEIGRLFIQLDSLVSESGGNIQSVSETNSEIVSAQTATASAFAGIDKYSYGMPLSFPSYFSFKNFLINSESALRILNIDSMDVSASDDGAINATLIVNTFVRK